MKKMDPNLPFHFFTENDRYMDDQPDFDDDDGQPLRLHNLHVNAREDGAIFAAGRQYLPARDWRTIRPQVHRFDVGLPPVPRNLLPDPNMLLDGIVDQ